MSFHNYVRIVPRSGNISMQIVVPSKFLDTSKLKKNFPLYMKKAEEEAVEFWKTRAGQKLNYSRDQYISSISSKQTDKGNVVLSLTGKAAVAIEMGEDAPQGSQLRDALLSSSKLQSSTERRRMKLPPHLVEKLKSDPTPKAPYMWMVIPMKDGEFRTFTDKPEHQDKWIIKSKADIIREVKQELKEKILPKHMTDLIKDSF